MIEKDPLESVRVAVLQRLERHFGLDVSPWKGVVPRILRRLTQSGDVPNILSPTEVDELAHRVFEELLLGHTRFYRHPKSWDWLRQVWKPDANRPMRAVVLGCSSGEEVYSVLALMAEKDRLGNATCLGADANRRSLDQAREGRYELDNVGNAPESWRQRAFVSAPGSTVQVTDEIRSRARFETMNLARSFPQGTFDLIVLRNVLIYLSRETIERILERCRQHGEGGVLVVAPQEAFMLSEAKWANQMAPGLPVYRIGTVREERETGWEGGQARSTVEAATLPEVETEIRVTAFPEAAVTALSSRVSIAATGSVLVSGGSQWEEVHNALRKALQSPPESLILDLSRVQRTDYGVKKALGACLGLLAASGCQVSVVSTGKGLFPLNPDVTRLAPQSGRE